MSRHGKHILMISLHGLIREHNLEMGRDADTGGQIKYVLELARALGKHPGVRQVDLFTRLIRDKRVSPDYSRPIEPLAENVRIVRIQCGGTRYIRKELLWPFLDEYVDKTLRFLKSEGALPDIIHGHYADAGKIAMDLAHILGLPFVFTGHSLGRSKKERLLAGGMSEDTVNKRFRIDHRIAVEEEILKHVDLVVTSTHQEVEVQYDLYENHELPRYRVIPPGIDLTKFHPYYDDIFSDEKVDEVHKQAIVSISSNLERFFLQPEKPLILALSRPEKRKNIDGLISAYGMNKELQALANLAVFAGIRKDISKMEENEREVLTEILLLMDKYDLYGKLAIPKKHDFEYEVPELYRIAAGKKGIFINTALTEPFGLTLLEAASCGLPIVATDDGGPRDIIKNCRNGILVDVTNGKEIARAIKKILVNPDLWQKFSTNGINNVRKHYAWDAHCKTYLTKGVLPLCGGEEEKKIEPAGADAFGRRMSRVNKFIISDIDNTLIGNEEALEVLLERLNKNNESVGFGIATGRTIDSAMEVLQENDVPVPDLIISSVGAEIYYGPDLVPDKGWESHISARWNREKIKQLLTEFDFLEIQEGETQRQFKLSYYIDGTHLNMSDTLARIHALLVENKCRYNLIFSHRQFIDILPYRASKGKAIRYLAYKWNTPLKNILVCGDSGNDEEMLRGEMPAIVVGNHSDELDHLKGSRNIYFSRDGFTAGILEGIENYRFLEMQG
ncbi:MAG: HAD-IIB family hydrolase [Deltaproteobacteria bacterium]|nr:HAD-IIB family hydrolase [Deltaproteobacteria bacterium]